MLTPHMPNQAPDEVGGPPPDGADIRQPAGVTAVRRTARDVRLRQSLWIETKYKRHPMEQFTRRNLTPKSCYRAVRLRAAAAETKHTIWKG
jgi:hypothetical protein